MKEQILSIIQEKINDAKAIYREHESTLACAYLSNGDCDVVKEEAAKLHVKAAQIQTLNSVHYAVNALKEEK